MAVDSVDTPTIQRVAEQVFGGDVQVTCVRRIGPSSIDGLTERPPPTRNVLYVVDLAGRSRSCVFRFSPVERGERDSDVTVGGSSQHGLLSLTSAPMRGSSQHPSSVWPAHRASGSSVVQESGIDRSND